MLCDRRTNELASDSDNPPYGPDGLGLRWLRSQARGGRVDAAFELARYRRQEDYAALLEEVRRAPFSERWRRVRRARAPS